MSIHKDYIKRCLQLAKNGLGTTRPNPMVGCVIVYNNQIIGEGFTSPYGKNHAEVNAINSVKNKALLKKATMYVSLEPCAHFGKTPPCANRIAQEQIPNVIIGCLDTNELVAGKGVAILEKAGCHVKVDVLAQECKALNKRFFTFHSKKRPFIILKWAATKDGFIAPLSKNDNKPVWITNLEARQLVHQWRSEEQAILVGTNTVMADNPSLTTRSFFGNSPTRIVLDANLRLSKKHQVFDTSAPTIVLCDSKTKFPISKENIKYLAIDFSNKMPQQICDVLYQNNIQSVIIEGGSRILQTFIDANLWDQARVFTGKATFTNGIPAPTLKNSLLMAEKSIVEDILKIYKHA